MRDTIDMAREAELDELLEQMPRIAKKFKAFEALVRADERARLEQPEPAIDKSAAIRIATALGWAPPAAPVQEPVALQMDVIVGNLIREGINKHRARELAEHFIKHTTPPAQREWVDLTDEEFTAIVDQACRGMYERTPRAVAVATAHATEAKLREKNGGAA